MRLVHAATSWLDGPAGLSRFMIPYWMYCWVGLCWGLYPWFGSVLSWFFVRSLCWVCHGGLVLGMFFCFAPIG